MRCGEGDATKRNAHLCERCGHRAMLVLDHIGMTVAFDGDGQLRWDALVTLSENAARPLARRAMQREDLLLQLRDPAAAGRAPEPAEPERFSILHQLNAERLVESTVDRSGEFWPEGACRLTAAGKEAADAAGERRRAEASGLPITEWSPRYVPEQGTEEEFREYAGQELFSPEGERYDASQHVMLRRGDGAPAGKDGGARKTHLFFDDEMWTTQPVRPVGYFVFRNVPAIAFDADGVQMLAEYYELVLAVAGPGVRWTIMEPTPANPMYLEGTAGRTIRADSPAMKNAAFVSVFQPPGERPGIRTFAATRAAARRERGVSRIRRRPRHPASRTSAGDRTTATREKGGRATMGVTRSVNDGRSRGHA